MEVYVLRRGRDQAHGRIIGIFTTEPAAVAVALKEKTMFYGDEWKLQVAEEGYEEEGFISWQDSETSEWLYIRRFEVK